MLLVLTGVWAHPSMTTFPERVEVTGPNTLDCEMRKAALAFGMQLQPKRAGRDVYDALQLDRCNIPPPAAKAGWPLPKSDAVPVPASAKSFFVDAHQGDDTNTGTEASPFRTVAVALAATRTVAARLSLGKPRAAIVLRSGVHYLKDTMELGAKDSGLTISAYAGEAAWISGGVPLAGTAWSQTSKMSGVWETDVSSLLSKAGQNVTGLFTLSTHRRLTRARYPNADVELYNQKGHNLSPGLAKEWTMPAVEPLPGQTFTNLTCDAAHPEMPCKDDSEMPTYNNYGNGHNELR
jgi:hypothetical protein